MHSQIAYNMDCMDLMKMLPDKEFDLAIVDPPYGINIAENMGLRKRLSTYESKKHKIQKWDAPPQPVPGRTPLPEHCGRAGRLPPSRGGEGAAGAVWAERWHNLPGR